MKKSSSERIDLLMWYTYSELQPTVRTWKLLPMDGLSWHLDLYSSWDDPNCLIELLNNLKHQWNDLESLSPNFNGDLFISSLNVYRRVSLEKTYAGLLSWPIIFVTHLKHLHALKKWLLRHILFWN